MAGPAVLTFPDPLKSVLGGCRSESIPDYSPARSSDPPRRVLSCSPTPGARALPAHVGTGLLPFSVYYWSLLSPARSGKSNRAHQCGTIPGSLSSVPGGCRPKSIRDFSLARSYGLFTVLANPGPLRSVLSSSKDAMIRSLVWYDARLYEQENWKT